MKSLHLAGLAGLASLGAQAQVANDFAFQKTSEPIVVTATRGLTPTPTLRDTIVITRDELESSPTLSLGEILQRRAGIDLRATGGPGQPQSLFIRGAGSAQTLVLVDGLRVGSATVGTTAIEHIPLEMIERVEVVKGPMSSLYGPEAMGGVIQIFTRGKAVPHLFIASAYGTDNDRRASAGLTTVNEGTEVAFAAGARAVDARSATNPRAGFLYNPDRDPYANAFFNARASQRLWQGETLSLEGFTTRSRTHFDSGPGDDRTEQQVSGAKLSSSTEFMPWWASRLWVGSGRDRLVAYGSFPSVFETQQDQASWINEFRSEQGTILLGAETNRQRIVTDANPPFAKTRRDIDSAFIALNEAVADQRVEASARHDRDAQFGGRNTGSVSYGWDIASLARLSGTAARGFRAPTFFDLYGPASDFYHPNPDLQPERSSSREITLQSAPAGAAQWKITAFDQRFDNLIVYSFTDLTVQNVARARSRGIEVSAEGRTFETRWRAAFTAQRARDEDTGLQLQGRAQRHGSVEVSRDFGKWTAGISVFASGQRFDSATESAASRLGGYAVVDARLRYAFDKRWSVELSAANLGDRRYESAVGYDAPRRTVLLNIRFESF